MIFVTRTPEPTYLATRAANWLIDLRAARKAKNKVEYKRIEAKYGNHHVRDALDKMFSGKCAYCEAVIGVVATSHIEHFRPKQKYPSLTFTWLNFLLGCPTCNDPAHKGTKFPKKKNGGPFIDPSVEDPSMHMEFVYDFKSCLALAKPITPQGKLMIDTFGLNKRQDLLKSRSDYIRTLLAIKPDEKTNPEFASILAIARTGRTPYHAWIRALAL